MTDNAPETTVNARTAELPPWVAGVENRMHELDPELTDAQIDIVRGYGEKKAFADGDWLWRAGERNASFYLVLSGEVQIVNTRGAEERIVITHGRGHYGGEVVTMAGRGALVGGRAVGDTTAIEVSAKRLRELIALESELGETMLISFIVRRMRMIAEEQGDVTLTGDPREPATGRLQSFLTRHGVPHLLINPAEDPDAAAAQGIEADETPALTMAGCMLKKPTIRQAADQLGIAAEIPEGAAYDVAIIGGGPSGMAAAVYAASEGLSAIVLECFAAGGQAATSSRIENYLGFPTGISGQGLAGRAFLQATKFGAEIAFARSLEKLECGGIKRLHLDGGDIIEARAVIIATGAEYREPPSRTFRPIPAAGCTTAPASLRRRCAGTRMWSSWAAAIPPVRRRSTSPAMPGRSTSSSAAKAWRRACRAT